LSVKFVVTVRYWLEKIIEKEVGMNRTGWPGTLELGSWTKLRAESVFGLGRGVVARKTLKNPPILFGNVVYYNYRFKEHIYYGQ
jgi:hypothetical protein